MYNLWFGAFIRLFRSRGKVVLENLALRQQLAVLKSEEWSGPLFNMADEVVGITTLYLEGGENLNFAIPVNDAKRLLSAGSKVRDFPVETSDPLANLGTPATPNAAPPNGEGKTPLKFIPALM